jgi:hypothetical protein
MKKSIIFLIAALFTTTVIAAKSWESGSIKQILVHDDGTTNYPSLVIVEMTSQMTTPPTCVATANKSKFAFDLSRPAAQQQYPLILALYMSGKKVTVEVNNSICIDRVATVRNVYSPE